MKRITVIASSAVLALVFGLNGCVDIGGENPSADQNISGKVIDSYLNGSKVCLDENNNYRCEINEVNTRTNTQGDYVLGITNAQHEAVHTLVANGGTNMGTNRPFVGILTAVKDINQPAQHITPLTTLVEATYQECKEDNCSISDAESLVAEAVGLTVEEINGDIVALATENNSTRPLQIAQALHAGTIRPGTVNTYRVYQVLAKKIYRGEGNETVDGVIGIGNDAIDAGVGAGNDAVDAGVGAGNDAIDDAIDNLIVGLN